MEQEPLTKDLKSQILTRIETESVCPRSRWFFGTRECAVWTLWFITAIFGAVAVAVSLSVVMQRQFSFYEATHENFFSFALEVLPYLWISIFILMILFAVYNLRHTKTGYRYPLWQIFGSSLVLSLAGGLLLHLAGAGFSLDHQMGMLTNRYVSQEKIEQKLWQQPEQGRLVGTFTRLSNDEAETFIFEAIDGTRYETNILELGDLDIELLKAGEKVRVLGQILPVLPPALHACAILPWVYSHEYSVSELRKMRSEMLERMRRHKKLINREQSTNLDEARQSDSLCAEMSLVRRLEFVPN